MNALNLLLAIVAALVALASLTSAQTFGDYFPGFSAASASGSSGGRSNTGNAGPILFPNSPPGSETSGVVVGASGFGFVPPGGRTGGARGVYPSLGSLRPPLGPPLGGPPLGLSPLGGNYRLGPLRSPLGVPLRATTTRLRPSVSYSTSHGALGALGAASSAASPGGSVGHSSSLGPLLWRLPGRSPSFLSGNTAAFSSGTFSSDDYL